MASGLIKTKLFTSDVEFTSFSAATNWFTPDNEHPAYYVVQYSGSDNNAPDTGSAVWRWHVWDYGVNTRRTQIATCPYRNRDIIYMRQKHDNNWYGWYVIMGNRYKALALTINTSASASGSGMVVFYGRVATISASIKYPATGTNLSLAWIPSSNTDNKWAPPEVDVWLSCDYFSNSGKQCEVKMTTGGNLVFNTSESNVDMKVSGSWITKGYIPL